MGRMDRYHSSKDKKATKDTETDEARNASLEDLNYDYRQSAEDLEREFERSRYEEQMRQKELQGEAENQQERWRETPKSSTVASPRKKIGFNGKAKKAETRDSDLEEPPVKGKKRRRRGKIRWFLRIFVLLIVLLVGYSIFGYAKGYSTAKKDTSLQQVAVTDFNGEKTSDGSINILLLGSDSRGEDQGRSDTIMLAHYSQKTKKIQLVSFMRDLYINIPGVGYDKINASYSYGGPELVRQTITGTFGIPIEYYAIVNFNSFPKIIDVLCPGGVEIDAEKEIDLDGVHIDPGNQKMDGHTLLQYARFRMDEEGDFGRVRRQQQVMNAVVGQVVSITGLLNLPEAAGATMGYTSTNLPTSVIMKLGTGMVLGKKAGIGRFTVPNDETGTWSYGSYDVGSVLEYDEQTYATAIQNFLE